jgi:hypothetical protein
MLSIIAARIAAYAAGGNSIPKAFVNIFVINYVKSNLDGDPMDYLQDRDGKEQPIQRFIQRLGDAVVKIPLDQESADEYVPSVREKDLYSSLITALKRLKARCPTAGLLHQYVQPEIDDLLTELEASIGRKFAFPATVSLQERHDYGASGGPSVPRGASTRVAVLVQRINPKTETKQWALVSPTRKDKSGKRRVLEWYGSRKPSEERVQKTESRIQWFSTGPGKKKKKGKKKKASTVFPGFDFKIF